MKKQPDRIKRKLHFKKEGNKTLTLALREYICQKKRELIQVKFDNFSSL